MITPNIFSYIKSQENAYETQKIKLGDNWDWNMRDHIQMIYHLKNGVFYTGNNDYMRAFKNIMVFPPRLCVVLCCDTYSCILIRNRERKDIDFSMPSKRRLTEEYYWPG